MTTRRFAVAGVAVLAVVGLVAACDPRNGTAASGSPTAEASPSAAHSYLLDEFLWSRTNLRRDRFGGSPAARAAFPAEVVRAVRAAISAAVPLIVRFPQFKERDHAARIAESPAELAVMLDAFAAAGADVLHASQRRVAEPTFAGSALNLAGWVKHRTGLPSITVGSVGLTRDFVGSPAQRAIVDRLDAGEFDVALGRALLANPQWVTHAAAGRIDLIHEYRKADENTYW